MTLVHRCMLLSLSYFLMTKPGNFCNSWSSRTFQNKSPATRYFLLNIPFHSYVDHSTSNALLMPFQVTLFYFLFYLTVWYHCCVLEPRLHNCLEVACSTSNWSFGECGFVFLKLHFSSLLIVKLAVAFATRSAVIKLIYPWNRWEESWIKCAVQLNYLCCTQ